MRKPKITLDAEDTDLLNPNFGKEAYEELKQIKAKREIKEYGFELRLDDYFQKVKPGDIILLHYPEVDIFAEINGCALFESGRQHLWLKYKDFVFKRGQER